ASYVRLQGEIMKMFRSALLAAGIAAALPAMAPWAAPPHTPWYFGGGVGQGHLNRSGSDLTGLNNAQIGNKETTYTVRAGYMFTPYWGLELAYYDLGKYDFHGSSAALNVDGQAKAKSAGVNFIGVLPIDQFDLYGRIGWTRTELKLNASSNFTEPANHKD